LADLARNGGAACGRGARHARRDWAGRDCHRDRRAPAAARSRATGEPQGDAMGGFPPRRAARAGSPARRGARVSSALKAGPVSGARYEALRTLVRVEHDRAFADIALEHALEDAKLDPRDAALCTEIVYGTLRWRRHLDWRLSPHLKRPLAKLDPWVRSLLRLTAYQVFFLDRVPRWAAVDAAA